MQACEASGGPDRRLGLRVPDARMNQDGCCLVAHGGCARFAPWVQEENGYRARPLLQSLVQRSRLPIGAEGFGEGGGFASIHGGEGPRPSDRSGMDKGRPRNGSLSGVFKDASPAQGNTTRTARFRERGVSAGTASYVEVIL